MSHIPILSDFELIKIRKTKSPALAMYSSEWGGIMLDPHMMVVPVDDHLVHRGDGIFEAIRVEGQKLYLFNEHWQRMKRSAEKIGLNIPCSDTELQEIAKATLLAAHQNQPYQKAVLRIFISRGAGTFSANPYDTYGSGLYVVVTAFATLPQEKYEQGVHAGFGQITWKEGLFAEVKSCNYLLNVLNKKEAVDRQLDYVIGVDSAGFLTESATENFVIVDQHGVLTRPEKNILKGTTMTRMLELAEKNKICPVQIKPLTREDVLHAREMMMIGTTIGVLPVTRVEGVPVADGRVGVISKKLDQLFQQDLI